MSRDVAFSIKQIRFDEEYRPSSNTRITTNFANLARGEKRQENLRNTLEMINNRFNALVQWDNPEGNRYRVELDIVSVDMAVGGEGEAQGAGAPFQIIEILKTRFVDTRTGRRIEGIVGNNFSSYVRDYDFSVRLPAHNKGQTGFSVPEDFGVLHGNLFKRFVGSAEYQAHFKKPPVICLSVSDTKVYHRTENRHPVLGVEYRPNESSLTEQYFKKMGLEVRYFMPPGSAAPLAFYFAGDLLNDYTNLELAGTIATMESFQKIYRPEIYNANAAAGNVYQPNLKNPDHSLTRIVYDREERSQLAAEQGKFAEEHFIKPYQAVFERWAAGTPA